MSWSQLMRSDTQSFKEWKKKNLIDSHHLQHKFNAQMEIKPNEMASKSNEEEKEERKIKKT